MMQEVLQITQAMNYVCLNITIVTEIQEMACFLPELITRLYSVILHES